MSCRNYLGLGILGFLSLLAVSTFQSSPGYMDADYYFSGGMRLIQGFGFSEEILWNYLNNPFGLPHPSHAYWMPMASILAALSMLLSGIKSFSGARLLFIFISASVPPLTAYFSFLITQRRDLAMSSGFLALFPAFYLAYLPTTDVFSLYMIFGMLSLMMYHSLVSENRDTTPRIFAVSIVLGLIAGLMHLTRTDGFNWIGTFVIFIGFLSLNAQFMDFKKGLVCILLSIVGYLIIMAPWMVRNLNTFEVLISPGGNRALWITNYNELFIYPASVLTPMRWWGSGLRNIIDARLWALGQNLQTTLAVQGEIFLTPLVLLGLWQSRDRWFVRAGLMAWCLTFIIMTFVFPFQGARGGFFHSGAALQPMFWVMAPIGLEVLLEWGKRKRSWNISHSRIIFQVGMIVIAFLLTLVVAYPRLQGRINQHSWNEAFYRYEAVDKALINFGATSEDRVLVNNSPGYFAATGRPSLSIPYGDLQMVLEVAYRYHVRYLILEIDQLLGDDNLFDQPTDRPGLWYLGSIEQVRIFEVELLQKENRNQYVAHNK